MPGSRRFRLRCLLVLLTLLTGLPDVAMATRRLTGPPVGMGAELDYCNVGPGLYFVQYRFYADCAINYDPEFLPQLRYQATGCGPARDTTHAARFQLLLRRGYLNGNPYCPDTDFNSCDSTGTAVNYATRAFGGILDLGWGPASRCERWTLSVSYGTRAPSRNVFTDPALPLYTEATLNMADAHDDSSPAFPSSPGFLPLVFVCDSTAPTVVPSFIVDSDNLVAGAPFTDSLAYALEAPWSGPQQPLLYEPGYSAAQPLPTVPGHPVVLDPVTGSLSFQAAAPYVAGPPALGRNKYALAYRVTTWRRLPGSNQRVRTASIRRETTVVVYDCPRPPLPPIFYPLDTARLTLRTDTIRVWLDEPDTVRFLVDQPTCTDSIGTYVTDNQVPGGFNVAVRYLGRTQQEVLLTWLPTAGTLPGFYRFTLQMNCRICPIPDRTDKGFILHVRRRLPNPAGPTGPGHQRVTAAPNPFTDETRLTLNLTAPLAAPSELLLYDQLGRLVDRLPVAAGPAGKRTLTWRPLAHVAPGLYYGRGPAGESSVVVRRL